jgi:protein-L-isoaspartate O-methyltransferase
VKLDRARRGYAGKIAAAASLRSGRLVDALAAVPREAFLGPGPWQIKKADETGHDYQTTPDDDPRHVYDNALSGTSIAANRHSCCGALTISTSLPVIVFSMWVAALDTTPRLLP